MIEVKVIYGTGTDIVGSTYYTTTSDGIQKAIDYVNSQGGGKVFISKGIYNVLQASYSGIFISGSYSGAYGIRLYSNIEIYGEGYGTVLKPNFSQGGSYYPSVISAIGASGSELTNIVIRDMVIGNTTATPRLGYIGIYCAYVGKVPTTGLTTGSYSRYDSTTSGNVGVNKNGVTIKNCIIQGNGNDGVFLAISSGCDVKNNIIQGHGGNGISLAYACDTDISGNMIHDNAGSGVVMSSAYGVPSGDIISGNVVQNNGANGIMFLGNNHTVSGNMAQNNAGWGIVITNGSASANNIICGNSVTNGGSGIYAVGAVVGTISGNTVSNCGNYGGGYEMYLGAGTQSFVVMGNVVSNSNGGYILYTSNNTIVGNVAVYSGGYGIIFSNINSVIVAGNIASSNSSGNISTSGSSDAIVSNINV